MQHDFPIISKAKTKAIPVVLLTEKNFAAWLKKQPAELKKWLEINSFTAKSGSHIVLPTPDGAVDKILSGVENTLNIWSVAHLPARIPAGIYYLEGDFIPEEASNLALGFALATYEFNSYKKSNKKFPKLVAPKNCDVPLVKSFFDSICWARDLINTPANDMNPQELAREAVDWAKSQKAKIKVIKGEDLLKENYPMIYTVGKAANIQPHLVDIHFARKGAPKIALVGKGVTFDSGLILNPPAE